MSVHAKTLEELVRALPPERQAEVRDFVEFLLSRQQAESERSGAGRAGKRQHLRDHFGVWDSGDENSADGGRIEADLTREYGDSHEPES